MTKADIVNEITKNTGIDKQQCLQKTLEAFMDSVNFGWQRWKCLSPRFGALLWRKSPKIARNISKTYNNHSEHNIPTFKPQKDFTDLQLKNIINKSINP